MLLVSTTPVGARMDGRGDSLMELGELIGVLLLFSAFAGSFWLIRKSNEDR